MLCVQYHRNLPFPRVAMFLPLPSSCSSPVPSVAANLHGPRMLVVQSAPKRGIKTFCTTQVPPSVHAIRTNLLLAHRANEVSTTSRLTSSGDGCMFLLHASRGRAILVAVPTWGRAFYTISVYAHFRGMACNTPQRRPHAHAHAVIRSPRNIPQSNSS